MSISAPHLPHSPLGTEVIWLVGGGDGGSLLLSSLLIEEWGGILSLTSVPNKSVAKNVEVGIIKSTETQN